MTCDARRLVVLPVCFERVPGVGMQVARELRTGGTEAARQRVEILDHLALRLLHALDVLLRHRRGAECIDGESRKHAAL